MKIKSLKVALLAMAMLVPAVSQAAIEYTKPEGDGSQANPYKIGTKANLYWFAGLVNGDANVCKGDVAQNADANAVLTADIKVNNTDTWALVDEKSTYYDAWTPIGTETAPYYGAFDGNGHVVSGLYYSNNSGSYVGLFGCIEEDDYAEIKNVGVESSFLYAKDFVGGVCGYNKGSEIVNCYSRVKLVSNGDIINVGGVCAKNEGIILNCYSNSDITGKGKTKLYGGGICGLNATGGHLENCYAIGNSSYSIESGTSNMFYDQICGKNNGYALVNCPNLEYSDFSSGKVAYLLQFGQSDLVWTQQIGTDEMPVLYGTYRVYEGCGSVGYYTNYASMSHDFSDKKLTDTPDANGLYSYVCKHNAEHTSVNKVIKEYNGVDNLELIYDNTASYEHDLYVEELQLADNKVLNIPYSFTAKKVIYDRKSEKDTMTTIFPCNVPIGSVNGKVYKFASFDGKALHYDEVVTTLQANTPYLIYKKERTAEDKAMQLISTLENVTVYPTSDTVEITVAKATQFGSYGREKYDVATSEYDYYGYKDGKFKKAGEDLTMSPYRAAIRLVKPATKSTRLNGNNELNIVFEDDEVVTGVEVIDAVSEFGGKVNVYDIAGRAIRLNVAIEEAFEGLKEGVYIVNGKKVLVSEK